MGGDRGGNHPQEVADGLRIAMIPWVGDRAPYALASRWAHIGLRGALLLKFEPRFLRFVIAGPRHVERLARWPPPATMK